MKAELRNSRNTIAKLRKQYKTDMRKMMQSQHHTLLRKALFSVIKTTLVNRLRLAFKIWQDHTNACRRTIICIEVRVSTDITNMHTHTHTHTHTYTHTHTTFKINNVDWLHVQQTWETRYANYLLRNAFGVWWHIHNSAKKVHYTLARLIKLPLRYVSCVALQKNNSKCNNKLVAYTHTYDFE